MSRKHHGKLRQMTGEEREARRAKRERRADAARRARLAAKGIHIATGREMLLDPRRGD